MFDMRALLYRLSCRSLCHAVRPPDCTVMIRRRYCVLYMPSVLAPCTVGTVYMYTVCTEYRNKLSPMPGYDPHTRKDVFATAGLKLFCVSRELSEKDVGTGIATLPAVFLHLATPPTSCWATVWEMCASWKQQPSHPSHLPHQ